MSQTNGNDIPPPEAPGYYQDAYGAWWWWDGSRWSSSAAQPAQAMHPEWAAYQQHSARQQERSTALLMWVLYLVGGGFISPLIFYFVSKDPDPSRDRKFLRHHCAEALNLSIVLTAVQVVAFIFILPGYIELLRIDVDGGNDSFSPGVTFWVGIGIIAVTAIANFVLAVIGIIKANGGTWLRLPIPLRLVRGSFKRGQAPYEVSR